MLAAEDPVPGLAAGLTHASPHIRAVTAGTIGRMGAAAEPLIASLVQVTKDPDAAVRVAAVEALQQLRRQPKDVVPALLDRLKDESPQVRAAALMAMAQWRPEPALMLPAMTAALQDNDATVRAKAGVALSFWEAKHTAEIRSQIVAALVNSTSNENPQVRWEVASALGRVGEGEAERVGPKLVELYADRYPHVRANAAQSTGALGPGAKPLIPALRELLADPESSVATQAAGAIIRIEPTEGLALLIKDAKDRDPKRRGAIAEALVNPARGNPAALDVIIAAVRDPDVSVRWRAIGALGRLGKSAAPATDALAHALIQDGSSLNRLMAAEALAQIGPDAAAAVPALQQASADWNTSVRKAAQLAALKITALPASPSK